MNADAGSRKHPGAGTPEPGRSTGSTPAPVPRSAAGAPSAPALEAASSPRCRNWVAASAARGLALFLGGFTLVNVVGIWRVGADFNIWWVEVPFVGRLAIIPYVLVGAALVAYAAAPRMRRWRRVVTVALALAFAAVTVWNGVGFYQSWRAGDIRPALPVPLSLVLCAALVFIAWAALRPPAPGRRRLAGAAVLAAVAVACVLLFPVAQVFFFGKTDYRRGADVAVVFGAQVHENGRASTSLSDRMTTAVELYKQGLVRHIIVSGGVGDSGYNEALVMKEMAQDADVPGLAIVVDSNGVNTDATVTDTVPFLGEDGWRRVLAVSQFYHLPRIKLAYQRAGWDVLTVPAGTSAPIPENNYLVMREIPAFWVYYARAIVS